MFRKQLLIHSLLMIGVIGIGFPIYFAFVAASHTNADLLHAPLPLLPSKYFLMNCWRCLFHNPSGLLAWRLLLNSFAMAMIIAGGKIMLAITSAYAIVYFDFPLKKICFYLIFMTLMLPVEVRILPTFEVALRLSLLNTFSGLTIPLLASATATFLFRQFFMTIPVSIIDAARMDGASMLRILFEIVLPISKSNIAALFVILFIYGWDQYLWPLVVTTNANMATMVMGMQQLATVADQIPQWNLIMTMALLALLPPTTVVIVLQRYFIKGLIQSDK